MARAISRRYGFSLGETVVAAVVLSLVIMVVLNLFPDVMALVMRNRTDSAARYTAQNELERTAALPFDSIEPGLTNIDPTLLPSGWFGSVEVSSVDGISEDRLKRIRVSVTYPTRNGQKTVTEEIYAHSVRR